jgi:hypothetical protein
LDDGSKKIKVVEGMVLVRKGVTYWWLEYQ